jgi:uncharacterized protein (DUF58 family)
VVDQSPSMAFGSADRLKSDVAEGVDEVLGRLAVRRGGRIGLVACGAPGARALPPRGGRGAAIGVLRAVQGRVAPDGTTTRGRSPRRCRAWAARAPVRPRGRRVSDFRDAHAIKRPLTRWPCATASSAVEVTDPREQELPASGTCTSSIPRRAGGSRWTPRAAGCASASPPRRPRAARRLIREIRSAGARHLELSTAGDWLRQLGRSFR